MLNLITELKRSRWGGRITVLVTTLLLTMLPSFAMAAGGEDSVKLHFSAMDHNFLYASLAFGAIAIIAGVLIRRTVMSESKGDEKMQEVGGAIRQGALAYLRQQGMLMAVFVVVVAILLFFMYRESYGMQTSGEVSGCFVLGVLASYLAGYFGMDAAVNANMRTAHAALTSYKKAFEIAFRSGAISGLLTVGFGLIGATLIFLLAGQDATKLLVGFGFGGSLAALFMRVGGGIYTKAADVGADLVGKVEAGIPEDDPRNAAVIADNVGDNVGDCAGMAADVFESYEVTLVAAIVLGAATYVIFDEPTWMRLIMFALMARGVGIIASIIGILTVKGNDSLSADPLKSIRAGFYSSACVSILFIAGLAYWMMGGATNPIRTSQLVTPQQIQYKQFMKVKSIVTATAKSKNKKLEEITDTDVKDLPDMKALALDPAQEQAMVQQIPQLKPGDMAEPAGLEGYRSVDPTDPTEKVGDMVGIVFALDETTKPTPQLLRDMVKAGNTNAYEFEITQTTPPPAGQPNAQPQVHKQKLIITAISDKLATDLAAKSVNGATFQRTGGPWPVKFYMGPDSTLAMAIDSGDKNIDLGSARPMITLFQDTTVPQLQTFIEKSSGTPPKTVTINVVSLNAQTVPWWTFAACVVFGIVMAFAFEYITDYYVSLHKRPVQELGAVATAGPAPMIINGFAYGQESAVFNVLAIVVALITPLIIFPVATYGSYIMSFYGIALVGLGLLTTTGFILAMDTFGPISDNAQGVFEMSGAGHTNPEGARRVQLLDAAGNTTKALTKGFAIATAVVAAVALFHAYVEEGMLTKVGMRLEIPEIFLGLLIGAAAPYLFSAFMIKAVGRSAVQLIEEVRSQFRNDPGIMLGTSKPDYAKCVAIVTASAQRELIGPGILAIAFPVLVAFGFAIGKPTTTIGGQEYNLVGAQALGGYLAGAIVSGQLLAVMLANSGGMWDNAKKLIEDGLHGGKGTEAHKAAVVCDTVGDPFKDTAGPAMNPLIKVMNLVGLLIVPLVIRPWPMSTLVTITAIAAVALVVAIWLSNQGGLASEIGGGGSHGDGGEPIPAPTPETPVEA